MRVFSSMSLLYFHSKVERRLRHPSRPNHGEKKRSWTQADSTKEDLEDGDARETNRWKMRTVQTASARCIMNRGVKFGLRHFDSRSPFTQISTITMSITYSDSIHGGVQGKQKSGISNSSLRPRRQGRPKLALRDAVGNAQKCPLHNLECKSKETIFAGFLGAHRHVFQSTSKSENLYWQNGHR